MTPGSHCYFDHYQGEPKNEPIAIGGFTQLKKYILLINSKRINFRRSQIHLGAQANLWTEYIETPSHVEYMIFQEC